MQFKRRNLLKGMLAAGAVPMASAASSRKNSINQSRVVRIRPGYYCVNGVVVTEQELQILKEEGVC